MAIQKTGIIIAITVTVFSLLLTFATIGVLGVPRGKGSVSAVNVSLYSDASCTTECAAIDWGNINPNSDTTKTIYIKNSGDIPLILNLATSNWKPKQAKSAVALSWNLENCILKAGEAAAAVLTLSATSKAASLTDFSFAITITGTQE